MKQQNIHNEEELYQEILAELKPGAEEYEHLMANGQNPACKVSRHSLYKYAACIALFLMGTATYFILHNHSENSHENLIAQTEVKTNPEKELGGEKKKEESLNTIDHSQISIQNPKTEYQKSKRSTVKQNFAEKTVEQTPTDQNSVDEIPLTADQSENESELAPTLIAEIEMRVLRKEQFQRELVEEIYTNIIELPNKPELSL